MPSSRSAKPWGDRLAGHPGLPELKYPGGLEELMRRLESEGHVVVQRGRRYFVKDFEKKLVRP